MTSTLSSDQTLKQGQQLASPNGRFHLLMQSDGNFVLYDGAPAINSAYWATNTWQMEPATRPTHAVMQSDGHLVLYNDAGAPAWGSGVWGPDFDAPRLDLQDDGNLVVYANGNQPIWASQTVRTAPITSSAPLVRTETTSVGFGKQMTTTATLYRNGRLTVESAQRNDNFTGGLRGRILVVCSDDHGRMIWLSSVIECPTRCSVPDVGCASYGTSVFQQDFPAVIGEYTVALRILQADHANYVDLRAVFARTIKAAQDLAPAVAAVLALL